jgi:hypothetical protein
MGSSSAPFCAALGGSPLFRTGPLANANELPHSLHSVDSIGFNRSQFPQAIPATVIRTPALQLGSDIVFESR